MRFLTERREKYDVENAVFLVDSAPWLTDALQRHSLRSHHETHGNRNAIERVFKEVKRRTNQFHDQFHHASPEPVETWLHTYALMHNQLH